jgi:hypothetical protein
MDRPDRRARWYRGTAAVVAVAGTVAVLVIAVAIGARPRLTDAELGEFRSTEGHVLELCKRPREGPALDARLSAPIDRLVALTKQEPEKPYDADPTNDPEVSDETWPAGALSEIAGVLSGAEVIPHRACSRRHAARIERALAAME